MLVDYSRNKANIGSRRGKVKGPLRRCTSDVSGCGMPRRSLIPPSLEVELGNCPSIGLGVRTSTGVPITFNVRARGQTQQSKETREKRRHSSLVLPKGKGVSLTSEGSSMRRSVSVGFSLGSERSNRLGDNVVADRRLNTLSTPSNHSQNSVISSQSEGRGVRRSQFVRQQSVGSLPPVTRGDRRSLFVREKSSGSLTRTPAGRASHFRKNDALLGELRISSTGPLNNVTNTQPEDKGGRRHHLGRQKSTSSLALAQGRGGRRGSLVKQKSTTSLAESMDETSFITKPRIRRLRSSRCLVSSDGSPVRHAVFTQAA